MIFDEMAQTQQNLYNKQLQYRVNNLEKEKHELKIRVLNLEEYVKGTNPSNW